MLRAKDPATACTEDSGLPVLDHNACAGLPFSANAKKRAGISAVIRGGLHA
jgi:hypothetical protein